MIIKTRYRDVPWEEVCEHGGISNKWWAVHRGKEVELITPPRTDTSNFETFDCSGPFFKIAGTPWNCCPHIAEIGD